MHKLIQTTELFAEAHTQHQTGSHRHQTAAQARIVPERGRHYGEGSAKAAACEREGPSADAVALTSANKLMGYAYQ